MKENAIVLIVCVLIFLISLGGTELMCRCNVIHRCNFHEAFLGSFATLGLLMLAIIMAGMTYNKIF